MKKIYIFSILSLFILLSFNARAVKKIEANPINIAVMLTQETDTARIASTCEYYGYARQHSQDDFTVFAHNKGSLIRYKFITGEKYPTIELRSNVSSKEKDRILKNLNFQKIGNAYELKTIGYIIHCLSRPHSTLIFTGQSKPK